MPTECFSYCIRRESPSQQVLKHPAPVGKGRLNRPLLSRQDLANGSGFVLCLDAGERLSDDVLWQTAGGELPRDAKPAASFDCGRRTDVRGRDTTVVEQAGCDQILNEDIDGLGLVLAVEQLLAKL